MCRPDGIGRNQEAGHGEAEYDGENAVEMARILFGRCKGPLNSTIVADSKNDFRIDAKGDKFREWLLWGGSVCSGAVDLRWDGGIRRYHLCGISRFPFELISESTSEGLGSIWWYGKKLLVTL